jgi:hypothetical protein
MFRKVDNCLVQVDLAIMKLRDTLEEVEKAMVIQGDDMAQRAAELHKVSEERFPNVTHSQDRRYQGGKSLQELRRREIFPLQDILPDKFKWSIWQILGFLQGLIDPQW